MNNICIVGRLTDAIELKQTQGGVSVASFSVAVPRPRAKDTTDFLNVVAWRQTAEYLWKYSKKGDRISVSGVLTSRKYETKDGKKATAFEIVAEDASILSSASDNSNGGVVDTPKKENATQSDFVPIGDPEYLPF